MEDINLDSAKVLPRLSVIPCSLISPAASLGQPSPKAMMHNNVEKSSSEAMTLKGSPFANANGALVLLSPTANHFA